MQRGELKTVDVIGQYLKGRKPFEQHPEKLLEQLLSELNQAFYAKEAAKGWLQDRPALALAITWPATWLAQRGISVEAERYGKILREIIDGIVRHGDVAKIKHLPTYFDRCVRAYFVHNGEELYEERKKLRTAIDLRFLKHLPAAPAAVDPIEALAAAHRVLASGNRRKQSASASKDASQLPLAGL